MGLGPLKDMWRRGTVAGIVPSSVELRRASSAEATLGAGMRGGNVITGGRSRLGGNGGGEVPSLGGNIGALGACLA